MLGSMVNPGRDKKAGQYEYYGWLLWLPHGSVVHVKNEDDNFYCAPAWAIDSAKRHDSAREVGDEHEPDGTYPAPRHGWTCFHCGETFGNPNLARAHFGEMPTNEVACVMISERGMLYTMRAIEMQRDEVRARLAAMRLGADEDEAVERFYATRGATS